MAFDTAAAAVGYKTTLNSYKNKIRNIQNRLNSDFNFGRIPSDDNYSDFWADLTDGTNIGDKNYNSQFDTISSISQEQNNLIDAKYMNILGMVQMLDSYMCYISDSYSRMIDIAWSCGLGGIYITQYGKDLPDGSKEILKKGVQYYTNEINKNHITMSEIIDGMDSSRASDSAYLSAKKNELINCVKKIQFLVDEVEVEIVQIVEIVKDNNEALTKWILECFQMVANITLVFNLNNKNLKVAQKPISIGDGFNKNTQVAISIAKFWKDKVSSDRKNQAECIAGAIKHGLTVIPEPFKIEKLKDMSWDLMIPKY